MTPQGKGLISMRRSLRAFVLGGSLLASASMAHAQVTLLDTNGTGAEYGNGSTNQPGAYVGVDYVPLLGSQNAANSAYPTAPLLPGYAALPFALNGSTSYLLSSVTIDAEINAPSYLSTSNQLYGAFVQNPTLVGGLLAPNTAVVGGFFQFNLTGAVDANGKGNNTATELTAISGLPALTPGNNYYLVIAPKSSFSTLGLDIGSGTSLTDLGVALTASQTAIQNAGGSLNNGITSVQQGLSADVSVALNPPLGLPFLGVEASLTPQYFGVKIAGTAVPEASTVATGLICLVSIGGLLRRRRTK
jgi:hypothetical protein